MFSHHTIFVSSETNDLPASCKKIPANIIPSAKFLNALNKATDTLPSMDDCKVLEYPWHIFEYNDWAIRQDFRINN